MTRDQRNNETERLRTALVQISQQYVPDQAADIDLVECHRIALAALTTPPAQDHVPDVGNMVADQDQGSSLPFEIGCRVQPKGGGFVVGELVEFNPDVTGALVRWDNGTEAWKNLKNLEVVSSSLPAMPEGAPNPGVDVTEGIHVHDDEWEETYAASDMNSLAEEMTTGGVMEIHRLLEIPSIWAAAVPGDDGSEIRYFATEAEAMLAAAPLSRQEGELTWGRT